MVSPIHSLVVLWIFILGRPHELTICPLPFYDIYSNTHRVLHFDFLPKPCQIYNIFTIRHFRICPDC